MTSNAFDWVAGLVPGLLGGVRIGCKNSSRRWNAPYVTTFTRPDRGQSQAKSCKRVSKFRVGTETTQSVLAATRRIWRRHGGCTGVEAKLHHACSLPMDGLAGAVIFFAGSATSISSCGSGRRTARSTLSIGHPYPISRSPPSERPWITGCKLSRTRSTLGLSSHVIWLSACHSITRAVAAIRPDGTGPLPVTGGNRTRYRPAAPFPTSAAALATRP